jgi:hypothetical protein
VLLAANQLGLALVLAQVLNGRHQETTGGHPRFQLELVVEANSGGRNAETTATRHAQLAVHISEAGGALVGGVGEGGVCCLADELRMHSPGADTNQRSLNSDPTNPNFVCVSPSCDVAGVAGGLDMDMRSGITREL